MMIINMVVVYKGQQMEYSMPVADGRMTIKWLGLAAAQRFTATVNPRGYRRHHEKPGPKGIISTSARLLPRRVYTCNATFLHPDKSIEEELTDGEKVFVELTSIRPLNVHGRPLRERWMFIAFSIGDQNAQERSIAIEEEYKAMEEDREQKRVAEEAREAEQAAEKGVHMRRVLASQLYCPEKVKRAFERDWAELTHPIRQPIDKITEDLEEQALIKDVVLANYVVIVEVFKHYASVGAMRSTGELEFMEYSAFMYDLRDFSDGKSRDLVEKTYGEALSTCRGAKGPTISGAMGVAEFIFAMIRLACTQHRVKPTNSAGRAWSLGESGFGLSPKAKGVCSAHEALKLLMENEMVPLAHQKVVGVQIKTALSTDQILSIYHDNHAELKAVFDHYSKINDAITTINAAAAAGAERLLNIFEFGKVVRDAKLMGGDNEEVDELTVREVRQAFAGAQNELCGGTIDSSTTTRSIGSPAGAIIRPPWEPRPPVEQMSYPEFLEGIARVAVLKWEDASLSLKVKIRRAIAAVSSLLETKHQ